MKSNFLKAISLCLIFVLVCVVNMPVSSVEPVRVEEIKTAQKVITVADNGFNVNEVYKTRFLNMLNHNFVYDEAFYSVEDIINDSMPALIKFRENEDDSFIAEYFVSDYIFNMFGIDFIDYSEVNADFEQIEGFVYIVPKGFATYEHEITSISENEDGSFTVLSNVKISSHDSGVYYDVCETLFVPNELSQFGFSIIHSNIGAKSLSI